MDSQDFFNMFKIKYDYKLLEEVIMNQQQQQMTDKMIENFSILKPAFKWDQDLAKWLVALAYTISGKSIDIDEIKKVSQHIKSSTGMFSAYRGANLFPLSGLICANSESPIELTDKMLGNYDVLKVAGLKQTNHLPVATYTMAMGYGGTDYAGFADKAVDVYKEMKGNHPILTGGDDYPLAILLAENQSRLDKIETYFDALKSNGFAKTNGLQMMSHILAFSDGPFSTVAENFKTIMTKLKENKFKLYSSYYPAVAIIALIGSENAIDELIDIAKYMKSQKQAKWLDKGVVIMLASGIVSTGIVDEAEDHLLMASLNVSIQAIVAAQQAAMIAAVSASAAAGATASS